MKTTTGICTLLAFIFMVFASGCSTAPKPFDYHPDNELKKGPGLFSGEEGAFTIYRKPAAAEKACEPGEKK